LTDGTYTVSASLLFGTTSANSIASTTGTLMVDTLASITCTPVKHLIPDQRKQPALGNHMLLDRFYATDHGAKIGSSFSRARLSQAAHFLIF
jgi:hypothetical protein